MKQHVILNVALKMMKPLFMSGVIVILSILIMQVSRTLGVLLMMIYSSWMVIQSSRNEMPLGKLTALLPGVMSLSCFLFMIWFIGVYQPIMPLIGVFLGLIPGFLMARGHRIYNKNGRVYAKRTYFYILIWMLSLLFTQGATLLGLRQIIDFGFLLNGFSTTMAVFLSIFLFLKAKNLDGKSISIKIPSVSLILPLILLFIAVSVHPTWAYTIHSEPPDEYGEIDGKAMWQDIANYVFSKEYTSLSNNINKKINSSSTASLNGKKRYHFFNGGKYTRISDNQTMNLSFGLRFMPTDKIQQKIKYEKLYCSRAFNQCTNLENGGYGVLRMTESRVQGIAKKMTINGVWAYNNFLLRFYLKDYPKHRDSVFRDNYKKYMQAAIARIQHRIKNIKLVFDGSSASSHHQEPVSNSVREPKPHLQNESQTHSNATENHTNNSPGFSEVISQLASDKNLQSISFEAYLAENNQNNSEQNLNDVELASLFDQILNSIEQSLHNAGYSESAVAAGIAIALIQLLAGLGMSAATIAAQETTAAVMSASQDGSDNYSETKQSNSIYYPDGSAFETNENGEYWGPDDNGDWRWLSRQEAEEAAAALNAEEEKKVQENKQRDRDFENFNEQERENRRTRREERLQDEGNIYDKKQDAWVRDPNYTPPRTDLEEYHDRVDFVENYVVNHQENHSDELSTEQLETVERILDDIKNNHNNDPDNALENIDRLTNAINDLRSGANQNNMAQAETDAIEAQHNEKIAGNLVDAGKQAAGFLESRAFQGKTHGAISSFLFEALQNRDKGTYEMIKNSTISATASLVGGKLGEARQGDVLWNAFTSGLTNAAETGAKGGNAEDMFYSGAFATATGGLFEHLQNVQTKNGGSLFDFGTKVDDIEAPLPDMGNSHKYNADINIRADDIGVRATDIGTTAPDINSRASDIGGRASDIGDDAPDMSSRASDIGARASDIGDDAPDINSRASDIGARATDIGATAANAETQLQSSSDIETSLHTRSENEQNMLDRIKQASSNDPRNQRIDAIVRGDAPLPEKGQKLASSVNEWNDWSQARHDAVGGASEAKFDWGIDRSTEVQNIVKSNKYPWLDRVDKDIRKAFAYADPTRPDSWTRFGDELKKRNLSFDDYDRWASVTSGSVSVDSSSTYVPGSADIDPSATRS